MPPTQQRYVDPFELPETTTATAKPPDDDEGSDDMLGSSSPPKPQRAYRNPRSTHGSTQVPLGTVTVGDGSFRLIAGPCAVETREQMLKAASAVKAAGGHALRGGAYKPRTSPYDFQGLGREGLRLLWEAGRQQGLPVVTEVLRPADVALCARYADVLQVGARNMQNYPLLTEVGSCERPVLLKRGMGARVDELLAAAEYILAAGNPNVILCERGIRTFETAMRCTLDLSAVLVLRERTHLPVIVDPSHAAGARRYVPALARAAKAVGAHGLIVEVHPNPDAALCDGPQALCLDMWKNLAAELLDHDAAA